MKFIKSIDWELVAFLAGLITILVVFGGLIVAIVTGNY